MKWTSPAVLSLVDRQVRAWESKKKALDESKKREEVWPAITIAREFGARGAEVAAAVGEATGFTIWDRELVHTIAGSEGVSERLMKTLDERRFGAVEDAIAGVIMGIAHTNAEYLRRLSTLVHTVASHGRAIIVGRGARYVLDAKDNLRVRIVCPTEQRALNYAADAGLSVDEARQVVVKTDRERDVWIKQCFKVERSDPYRYDLIINSSYVPAAVSAELVVTAYNAKFDKQL